MAGTRVTMLHQSGHYDGRVDAHVRAFFSGHEIDVKTFERGPIQELFPGWHALEIR